MESSNHPWNHRLIQNKDFDVNDFVGKWLHNLSDVDLTNPAMSITNGWGARHMENKWYADELYPALSVYAYDTRGQGQSLIDGDLDAIQGAIDLNNIVSHAFDAFDRLAYGKGLEPGNKILQGNCMGTMPIAALFAGKFPLAKRSSGAILISPVTTFDLPLVGKTSYFLPTWLGKFVIRYFAEDLAKLMVSGEESETSRQVALKRLYKLDIRTAVKQARQIFWKENVTKLWPMVDVPVLMLVSRNDPLTTLEDSAEVYHLLNDGKAAPIWMELEAPDHLLLEDNIDFLSKLIPKFAKDPWGVYGEYRYLSP